MNTGHPQPTSHQEMTTPDRSIEHHLKPSPVKAQHPEPMNRERHTQRQENTE